MFDLDFDINWLFIKRCQFKVKTIFKTHLVRKNQQSSERFEKRQNHSTFPNKEMYAFIHFLFSLKATSAVDRMVFDQSYVLFIRFCNKNLILNWQNPWMNMGVEWNFEHIIYFQLKICDDSLIFFNKTQYP